MKKAPYMHKRKPLLKTTVTDEFLKDEFEGNKVCRDTFGNLEEFKRVMSDVTKSCPKCGVIIWKGCDNRCFCTYEETIK